ncbi:MAG: DNA mismatch repair endonuclease MutL [Desulfovibrionaceae bacterium]|nr:DNA mismatch repair endonuclease MutL [Desulfovibrionaceae bacterium]MBF0514392.1 DNA mismatch repair endonuclease MutL [Desulfovibrionaceae bacterium]
MESGYRPIRILPPALQNQIAAGEVVERPASVVKELVENSLDAGATRVSVDIDGGGQGLIVITDDGRGMDPAELPLALTRHATSKIADIRDLHHIRSFGFRGEALPAVASVSRLKITSKSDQYPEASFVEVEFGRIVNQGPAASKGGTRIELRDLFVNVPARLKFLRAPSTETKRCIEALTRMALARLDVAFNIGVGGQPRQRFVSGQNLLGRLAGVWPPAVVEGLIELDHGAAGYAVSGLAAAPRVSQGNASRMYFYVNGRPVQDRILMRAVIDAYKGKLVSREYPAVVLFLTVPPEDVDVNVHPAKTEVRFRDEGRVFAVVRQAVSQVLAGPGAAMGVTYFASGPDMGVRENAAPLPGSGAGAWGGEKFSGRREYLSLTGEGGDGRPADGKSFGEAVSGWIFGRAGSPGGGREEPQDGGSSPDTRSARPASPGFGPGAATGAYSGPGGARVRLESKPAAGPLAGAAGPRFGPAFEKAPERPGERPGERFDAAPRPPLTGKTGEYLGQIAGTYLALRRGDATLTLLDQHAAHERVIYAAMRASRTRGDSRRLASPLEMSLHPAEAARLDTLYAELRSVGFLLERPAARRLLVKGAPPTLTPGRAKEYLSFALSGQAKSLDDLWIMLACKAAVKAGCVLAPDEAMALLAAWEETPDKEYCPHGRPAVVTLGLKELEKLFKRRK